MSTVPRCWHKTASGQRCGDAAAAGGLMHMDIMLAGTGIISNVACETAAAAFACELCEFHLQ